MESTAQGRSDGRSISQHHHLLLLPGADQHPPPESLGLVQRLLEVGSAPLKRIVYSFIPQTFTGHLEYARHYSRHWEYAGGPRPQTVRLAHRSLLRQHDKWREVMS